MIPGILIGLTFGAIPGLQISMAMANSAGHFVYEFHAGHAVFNGDIYRREFRGKYSGNINEYTRYVFGDRDGL